MADGSLVHRQERASFRVFDPHRLRVVLEEDAIALLGRAQRIQHPDALGDFPAEQHCCLLAVILHGARAHLEHRVEVGAVQDRLESAPPRDRRARDAGVGPEAVNRSPQHPFARYAVQIAGAGVCVLDRAGPRIDDDQRLGDALEQIAVAALCLAQHLLRRLLLDHAAQLGASAGDPGKQGVVGRLCGGGEELDGGHGAASGDRGEGKHRSRSALGIRAPLGGAFAQDFSRQTTAIAAPASLGHALERVQTIGLLEVPDGARRVIVRPLGELHPSGLPARCRADALQGCPERILEAGGALGRFAHRT